MRAALLLRASDAAAAAAAAAASRCTSAGTAAAPGVRICDALLEARALLYSTLVEAQQVRRSSHAMAQARHKKNRVLLLAVCLTPHCHPSPPIIIKTHNTAVQVNRSCWPLSVGSGRSGDVLLGSGSRGDHHAPGSWRREADAAVLRTCGARRSASSLSDQAAAAAAGERTGGGTDLRQALEALQQAASEGPRDGADTASRVAGAVQALAAGMGSLDDDHAVAAVTAAARLLSAAAAPSPAAATVLRGLLAAAAEQRLVSLPAPRLAAISAVWPAGGAAEAGTAAVPPVPSIVPLLEAALRRRQPPGSWPPAAIADLATGLRRAGAPASSGAYLSLAMLAVEAAERQRLQQQQQQQQQQQEEGQGHGQEEGRQEQGRSVGSSSGAAAFSAQQLTALVGAFARAGHYNQAAFDVACLEARALLQRAGMRLARDEPPAHGKGPAAAAAASGAASAGTFTARELAAFLAACAEARHFDARLLPLAAGALARCRHGVALPQLAQAAFALAELNAADAALCERAAQVAQQWMAADTAATASGKRRKQPQQQSGLDQGADLQQQQPHDTDDPLAAPAGVAAAARLAWALVAARHFDDGFFAALSRLLSARAARAEAEAAAAAAVGIGGDRGGGSGAAGGEQLSEDDLARLFEVQGALTDAAAAAPAPDARAKLLALSLPAATLVRARAAWLARRERRGGRGGAAAAFRADVRAALLALGLGAQFGVPTPCGLHVADALVRVPPAVARARALSGGAGGAGAGAGAAAFERPAAAPRFALSLDGPEAFAANAPGAPTGATAARWRALQAQGVRVVSVRWADWERLPDDAAKQAFLWQALLDGVAGVAATLGGGGVGAAAAAAVTRAPAAAAPAAESPGAAAAAAGPSAAVRLWRRILTGGGQ